MEFFKKDGSSPLSHFRMEVYTGSRGVPGGPT